MVKKVALLTSGGDAPGMNAAIRAIVRAGLINDLEMYAVFEGFKGLSKTKLKLTAPLLCGGNFKNGPANLLSKLMDTVNNLKALHIDTLVVIGGGDGSYRGASALCFFSH